MLPSDDDIAKIINTKDVFKFAILGFSAVELALDHLINEAMPAQHKMEIQRLSIPFKVDLAIALNAFDINNKGLLIKLSKMRNFYAHEFTQDKDYCPVSELVATWSKQHKQMVASQNQDNIANNLMSFSTALRYSFVAGFYDVKNRIDLLKKFKIEKHEHMLYVEALLEDSKGRFGHLQVDSATSDESDKRIAIIKERLRKNKNE